jgi:thioesterase domain-containing protein
MKKPLVIFIHGALSSSSCWNYIKYSVRRELKSINSHSFDYEVSSKPAVEIVQDLYDQILPLALVDPEIEIIFVGHSYGGVLSVEIARKLEHDSSKITVLTLASPLGGSGAASVMKLFRPHSHLFRNVGSHDKFMLDFKSKDLPCKTYSIITSSEESSQNFLLPGRNDSVVTVESQEAFLEDAQHFHRHLDCNHFEVLLSPAVGEIIRKLIKDRKTFESEFKTNCLQTA